VATTRFPNSAVVTYRKEKDFHEWKNRLHIFGLDLRDVIGIEAFCQFIKLHFGSSGGVDIVINNACQTIRRPTKYYQPIIETEMMAWKNADNLHKGLLTNCKHFEQIRRQLLLNKTSNTDNNNNNNNNNNSVIEILQQPLSLKEKGLPVLISDSVTTISEYNSSLLSSANENSSITINDSTKCSDKNLSHLAAEFPKPTDASDKKTAFGIFESTGLSHSTALSQMVILPDDIESSSSSSSTTLPKGLSDINGQQLDLRKNNSWLFKMEQVSTPELMECMFINAMAPFILNSRLLPLMTITSTNNKRPDRYIINVSAMEGKFYRYKMPNHPHTNMAKAALNMLTRTSAQDLAENHRIFMNSVDTGWINDENPLEKASLIAKTNQFQTPIDEIDAASRIVDPIFIGVTIDQMENELHSKKQKEYGKFYKDYKETEW